MIRIKLLKHFSTNQKGLKGGVALEVGKDRRRKDGTMPKADLCSSRDVCPLEATGNWLFLLEPGSCCVSLQGLAGVKMCVRGVCRLLCQ